VILLQGQGGLIAITRTSEDDDGFGGGHFLMPRMAR
jgi:hypothetical protein